MSAAHPSPSSSVSEEDASRVPLTSNPSATAHGPSALLGPHGSVHRKLLENRLTNQTKRKAHESAKQRSTEVCAPFIGDFIRCEEGRLLSTVVACQQQNAGMYACMHTYMQTEDAQASIDAGHAANVKYLAKKHGQA
jgi:hypothetical protein